MKPLAPNNRFIALIPPGVLLVGLIILAFKVNYDNIETRQISIILGLYLFAGLWFFFSNRKRNIYFDNDHIYLIRNKSTILIPIENLRRLKLTRSDVRILGIQFWQYKIEYANEKGGGLSQVHFWTGGRNERIENFEMNIKRIKPNIIIEHWAHSFE